MTKHKQLPSQLYGDLEPALMSQLWFSTGSSKNKNKSLNNLWLTLASILLGQLESRITASINSIRN